MFTPFDKTYQSREHLVGTMGVFIKQKPEREEWVYEQEDFYIYNIHPHHLSQHTFMGMWKCRETRRGIHIYFL